MPIEIESPEQLGYGRIRYNLAESSFSDRPLGELAVKLDDLVLQYHDHLGHPRLRALLGALLGVAEEEVIVTVGAAAALFIVSTSLLEKDDHLVVVRPNYATNIETPRAIGCSIDYLDLHYEDHWALDLDKLASLLKPNTRLISLTCPHNPTGAVFDLATLRGAITLAETHGCKLLVDETYREMTFGDMLPSAASLSPNAISVSSLSKTYGLPGIRLGWLVTRDQTLRETFLAAKEQIFICNSIVDEEIGYQALVKRDALLSKIRGEISERFEIIRRFFASQSDLEWIEPAGGVVGFARMRADIAKKTDLDRFYRILLEQNGTVVGPGHWFEQPRHYMRLGFGWPTREELSAGLAAITQSIEGARR